MLLERCNIEGGGYAFSARSGQPTCRDCEWRGSCGVNFFGDSRIRVERCALRELTGKFAVALADTSQGQMVDCAFDKTAMLAQPAAKGRITVAYTLEVRAVDAATGKPPGAFTVTARPSGQGEAVAAQSGADQVARLTLTEFAFTSSGDPKATILTSVDSTGLAPGLKTPYAPYTVTITAEGYTPGELRLPMDAPTSKTIKLTPSKGQSFGGQK
jgi:hypothetical protein